MAAGRMEFSVDGLPPPVPTAVNSSYGDREILSAYCGYQTPRGHFLGEWQHGWLWKEYNCHPEMIIGSDGLSRTRKFARHYVARQDQVEALQGFRYSDVHAIGLPIIYMNRPAVERIKGSVLVLPSHSLPERDEGWTGEEYQRYLSRWVPAFTRVGICLSGSCVAKGYWKELYPLADDLYMGASEQDRNSLLRLAILFSRYEYVTTNDFGSHVPYAAYFGAKVSVAGPRVDWNKVDAAASMFYKKCPECLAIMKRVKSVDVFENYSQFCVEPPAAIERSEWARWQLGQQHKRSPRELRRLFGWSLAGRVSGTKKRAEALTHACYGFAKRAWQLMRTLGIPGLVAALQLRTAASRKSGSSRVWCGWTRRLTLRNGTTDVDVFEQHFGRREILDIPFPDSVSTVVDLGANVGISVEVFRQIFPRARIIAVELEKKNAELCSANHASDRMVTIVKGAVWSEPGVVGIGDVGDGDWAYQVRPRTMDGLASSPAFTYPQILAMHDLNVVDVMKMDIEGAEAEVLEASWADIFRTTAVSIIEIHDTFEGIEARVRKVIEDARKQFDLDITTSGEFWVIRNKALLSA